MGPDAGAPDVTVVIPTRDRWQLLSGAAASALAQEDVELELIVVDDGSSGEPPGPALADPRVTLVRNERSRGVAAARNVGIARAQAEWVAFLDDDDLWAPRKLKTQLDAASTAGADWTYGASIVVDASRCPLRVSMLPPAPTTVASRLLARNVIPAGSSNVVARTAVLRRLGGFDERLEQLADWDLWIRLAAEGPPAVCQKILVAYTQHAGSMLLADSRAVMDEVERIAEKHRTRSRAAGGRARPRRDLSLDCLGTPPGREPIQGRRDLPAWRARVSEPRKRGPGSRRSPRRVDDARGPLSGGSGAARAGVAPPPG